MHLAAKARAAVACLALWVAACSHNSAALSVDPASATIAAGAAAISFSSSNSATNWALSGPGSIDPATGATTSYTPPASVDAPTTVTLTATAGADTAHATILVNPGLSVTVSPPTATVGVAQTADFTAAASPTLPTVSWTLTGPGSFSPSSGGTTTYTAPSSTGSGTTATLIATAGGVSGSAVITIAPPSVTVSPALASIVAGGTQNLTATVIGSSSPVSWSLTGSGSLSSTSGATITYTAPASVVSQITATVTATAGALSGSSTINVFPGILPADRQTVWNPGLNSVGGIPNRTVACASLSPSGSDDTDAIQAAIDGCASGKVVQLAAGTYNLLQNGVSLNMKSNVTVRGAVDGTGRPITKFLLPNTHDGGAFTFGDGGEDEGFLVQPVNLTADGLKDSTSVTVASNPGYVVGELLDIDQLHADPIWLNPDHFNDPFYTNNPNGTEENRNMFCRWDRMIGQTVELVSVTGTGPYTLKFSTPLHTNYLLANTAQVTRHSNQDGVVSVMTHPVEYAGLENVYIEGGHYNGHIVFLGAAYSWVKNVEIYRWLTPAISVVRSMHIEIRDSYLHQTQDPNPGSGGYAIDVNWHSADNLLENNIVWAANKVIVMRASGGGNVIGYNYFEDGFGSGYLTIPEAGANASHFAGPHMELFEGNQSWNLWGDAVWGNSLWITFFRNNATSIRRNVNGTPYIDSDGVAHNSNNFQNDSGNRIMVQIGATHDYYSFIGNVLGYSGMPSPGAAWVYDSTGLDSVAPAIYNIGPTTDDVQATLTQSNNTKSRTIRHGNWDYGFTNGIVWDPSNSNHTIPNSLYLGAAPAFFGSNTWPWVNPLTGSLATLPARARFDAMLAAGKLTAP